MLEEQGLGGQGRPLEREATGVEMPRPRHGGNSKEGGSEVGMSLWAWVRDSK